MEKIVHKYVQVNGLKLHVAEIGSETSLAVVFLHGFPEIWYSWRHQMIAVAGSGFRAIAPDYRGYGLSDPPPEPEKTTFLHLADDLLALIDALNISKVFLIGKDFGVAVLAIFTLLHRDRVSAFATIGIPFMPPHPPTYLQSLPRASTCQDGRLEPGRAEADFGRLDAKTVVRNVYILFSKSELPTAQENQEIMDLVEPDTPLPHWFTEEDLATYGALYENSGFRTALQIPYRATGTEYNIPDPKVEIPALLIMGEKDYVLKFPGIEEYIRGTVKLFVPNLEIAYLPEGSHFVQEQSPDEVNKLILNFLKTHV